MRGTSTSWPLAKAGVVFLCTGCHPRHRLGSGPGTSNPRRESIILPGLGAPARPLWGGAPLLVSPCNDPVGGPQHPPASFLRLQAEHEAVRIMHLTLLEGPWLGRMTTLTRGQADHACPSLCALPHLSPPRQCRAPLGLATMRLSSAIYLARYSSTRASSTWPPTLAGVGVGIARPLTTVILQAYGVMVPQRP